MGIADSGGEEFQKAIGCAFAAAAITAGWPCNEGRDRMTEGRAGMISLTDRVLPEKGSYPASSSSPPARPITAKAADSSLAVKRYPFDSRKHSGHKARALLPSTKGWLRTIAKVRAAAEADDVGLRFVARDLAWPREGRFQKRSSRTPRAPPCSTSVRSWIISARGRSMKSGSLIWRGYGGCSGNAA